MSDPTPTNASAATTAAVIRLSTAQHTCTCPTGRLCIDVQGTFSSEALPDYVALVSTCGQAGWNVCYAHAPEPPIVFRARLCPPLPTPPPLGPPRTPLPARVLLPPPGAPQQALPLRPGVPHTNWTTEFFPERR